MNAQTVSLGEFVKQLTLRVRALNVQMPFANEHPWHSLFYELKKENVEGKPAFLNRLFFDWNSRYPRSQELSDYIHALHYTGCVSASNPHYDQIEVNDNVARLWQQEDVNALEHYLNHAAGLARRHFTGAAGQ
jgi:hypothetical protein